MILYYQEKDTKDWLGVDEENLAAGFHTGRAAAIANLPGSVCTIRIDPNYIEKKCRPVRRRDVPAEWLAAMGLEDDQEEA